MSERMRNVCFTVNNFTDADILAFDSWDCDYMLYAKEIGAEGTPHLQGYFEMSTQMTLTTFKKKLHPTAHFEKAKGTADHNLKYIVGPFVDGDKVKPYNSDHVIRGKPKSQGKRSDLETTRAVLKETGKMRDVVEVSNSFQSIKMAEVYLKYHEKSRTWKPEVSWFYGATGTGKTKLAYELMSPCYTCCANAKWFEGYDAHENVIIDDMRFDTFKFNDLLRFLDRYEYRVECKGSSRQFLAKKIIITAPTSPTEMFRGHTDEHLQQLIRRIDIIKEFK